MFSVANIAKSIKGRPIVQDISFHLKPGEIVGLMGPNGAGKSTSFYLAVGLLKADKGSIKLDGQDISDMPLYIRARMGIAYLPQESSTFQHMSVEDNIMVALEISEDNPALRHEKLLDITTQFAIEHIMRTPAIALSGGERRKVEIARCLAINPKYIFLDEPFAGIDPIAIRELQSILIALSAKGIGILITEHNVDKLLPIITRGYIIYAGKVLVSGNVEEITSNVDVQRLYLGQT